MDENHFKNFKEYNKLEICYELLKEIIKITTKENKVQSSDTDFRYFRSQFYNTDTIAFPYKLSGKLKTHISDFKVTEVLQDGSYAELTSKDLPDYDKQLGIEKDIENTLPDIVSELNEKLNISLTIYMVKRVIDGKKDSLSLTSENLDDKPTRTFVHEKIRDLGCLDSVTKEKNVILVSKFKSEKSQIKAMKRKQPGYLLATLKKESISHFDAIYKIARSLKIHEALIGTSGIKDKYAVTLQRISIKNITASQVLSVLPDLKKATEDRVDMGNFIYSANKISMGDHYGNNFKIVIRNVEDLNDSEVEWDKVFEKTEGYFINYYGDQRFGSKIFSSDKRGKLLLKRRFLKFIANLYFFENVINDFGVPSEREMKVKENYQSLVEYDFTEVEKLLGERRKLINEYILKNAEPTKDNPEDDNIDKDNPDSGTNHEEIKIVNSNRDDSSADSSGKEKIAERKKARKESEKVKKKEKKLKDKDVLPKPLLKRIEEKAEELYKLLDEIKIGPDARNIYKNINLCNSFEDIVKKFPKSYITLFLHAYQSYLWNKMATERIELYGYKPAIGDLVLKKRKDGKSDKIPKYLILTERNIQHYAITDVVLPLISRKSIFPENKIKEIIMEVLKNDDITLNNFAKTKKLSNISGSYRKLIEKADIISLQKNETDLEMEFSLKSSTYATMFIREIMRNDKIN